MASTDSTPSTQRAAASNVAVVIGTATILLDLVPAAVPNKDKAEQFHQMCTTCDTPVRLQQRMVCPHNHAQDPDKRRLGKTLPDKTVTFVTAEEVAGVRGVDGDDDGAEGGPKSLNLVPVRTADVMEHTLPGDIVYRLRPNKKTTSKGSYDMLRVFVAQALRSGKVLVGELSIRSKPKLFWLSIRHDQVIAQALMRPDDIAPFDVIPKGDVAEKIPGLAAAIIDQLTVEFDPHEWRNRTRERAEELVAAKTAEGAGVTGATITQLPTSAKAEIDLEGVLSSMLAS